MLYVIDSPLGKSHNIVPNYGIQRTLRSKTVGPQTLVFDNFCCNFQHRPGRPKSLHDLSSDPTASTYDFELESFVVKTRSRH